MRELQAYQDETVGWYRAYEPKPNDVAWQMFDGKYYRAYSQSNPDGSTTITNVPVCEDCWKDVPKYIDFPRGLTSPESDGDSGGNFAKHRKVYVMGSFAPLEATEAIQKIVCRECYLDAFERVYPGAKPPKLRSDIHTVKDEAKIEQPVDYLEYAAEPRI